MATSSSVALVYNDVHVLENMHASLGMQLLLQPQNNFLADLSQVICLSLRLRLRWSASTNWPS